MAQSKDYVKATSPVIHYLTYADNLANGYFQKQGFTQEVTLPKPSWIGSVKDDERGILMQCIMLPRSFTFEAKGNRTSHNSQHK
jgi:histone acetyltransferase